MKTLVRAGNLRPLPTPDLFTMVNASHTVLLHDHGQTTCSFMNRHG